MSKEIPLGLSFDDVLLIPQHSSILPSDAQLGSRVTAAIDVRIPVLSSAMDTVTEDRLAIALAREGGMGVIHRNCLIHEQAAMVAKVKRAENTVIDNPLTVPPTMTINELKATIERTGISGFPVVNSDNVLLGIVSRRDIWISEGAQTVAEVMTGLDQLITGNNISVEEAKSILYKNRIEKLPLINDAGHLVGLMTTADIEKRMMYTNACKDENGHLRVGGAIGVGPDCFERAKALINAGADALFIDAATGHTSRTTEVLSKLKSEVPEISVIAGNVVTAQGAKDLIDAGAAAIKVGVGPGSICTTRVISGVGVPQFTAIQNVAPVCREHGVPCIADGGLRYSGDLVKALAAGADCVMLGSLLAGTEESPGNTIRWQGRAFKEYRGMGSTSAMRQGSGDRYGQNSSGKLVPEGVEARVPYKGKLSATIFQLMGGIRSGMGYLGAETLEALREKAVFNRITAGGLKESHPHDIVITEEPVNYSTH